MQIECVCCFTFVCSIAIAIFKKIMTAEIMFVTNEALHGHFWCGFINQLTVAGKVLLNIRTDCKQALQERTRTNKASRRFGAAEAPSPLAWSGCWAESSFSPGASDQAAYCKRLLLKPTARIPSLSHLCCDVTGLCSCVHSCVDRSLNLERQSLENNGKPA